VQHDLERHLNFAFQDIEQVANLEAPMFSSDNKANDIMCSKRSAETTKSGGSKVMSTLSRMGTALSTARRTMLRQRSAEKDPIALGQDASSAGGPCKALNEESPPYGSSETPPPGAEAACSSSETPPPGAVDGGGADTAKSDQSPKAVPTGSTEI